MRLSTRTRYGIIAIVELAGYYQQGPLRIKDIAAKQNISIKYLEQLMTTLKAAGLVGSVRGAKGGYVLAKPPGEIKLSDCFSCLEGPIATVECVEDDDFCSKVSDCVARDVWVRLENAINEVLSSITLQDMIEK